MNQNNGQDLNNLQKKTYRIIYHIDMNCFFASCHIARDPSLKGLPVVVAHPDRQGKSIILTATYEARKYGIYTTMLTGEAIRLCPKLRIIKPEYELYESYSKQFIDYLFKITPLVQQVSIDEAFIDVTDVVKPENAIALAHKIQNDLMNQFSLPCSIGVAPNRFLAKMGSDMKKPMGITVVRKRELEKVLWPLDIKDMFGVGKKTQPKLREIGINTIGDIVHFNNYALLEKTVGPSFAQYLIDKAYGNDDSPVQVNNDDDFSSVSNEHTFSYNVSTPDLIKTTIKVLAGSVSERLQRHQFVSQTIGIKIKYSDFITVQRSISIKTPTNDDYVIYKTCANLFDEYYDEDKLVRLIGVFCNRLTKENKKEERRLTLFDDLDKEEKKLEVNKLLSNINNLVGSNIINVGIKNIKNKDEDKK